jgi:hypothetical protein
MPHNRNKTFRNARENVSTAVEARRLRFEYTRLRRQLTALRGRSDAKVASTVLRSRVDHIARVLGSIRADSVHAVESKLKVALDLADGGIDQTSHKLFSSALADLHYLALLSEARSE